MLPYRLTFSSSLGRALVFPALVPDFHRLPFATCFGTRVVRYRLIISLVACLIVSWQVEGDIQLYVAFSLLPFDKQFEHSRLPGD